MLKRTIGIFCTIFVLIAAVSFSSAIVADNAQAQVNNNQAKTTCAIEKIGWILCPVIESFAKINDFAFEFIAKNFLEVDAELFDNDSGTLFAWEKMRDIANVAFVLAFLILIYSQITGMGAGSYGWKRMLPRLIIAAILVNSSYYICQLLVDLSNIIGYALKEMLTGIADEIYKENAKKNEYGGLFDKQSIPMTVIAVAILGSAAVWLLMPILGTVILSTIVILLMVVIILLLRKALVVLLIFIAPLAFVAYLLPNTEKYFKKWMSMFGQLLVLFPVIALLFGAGQVASATILGSTYDLPTSNDPATAQTSNGNAVDEEKQSAMAMGLIAAAMAILPFAGTIAVSRALFAGMGMVAGAVTAMNKGMAGRASGAGKKWDQNSAYNRGKAIRDQAKQNYKTAQFANRMTSSKSPYGIYTRRAAGGISGLKNDTGLTKLADKMHVGALVQSGSSKAQGTQLDASTSNAVEESLRKNIEAERSFIRNKNQEDMRNIALGNGGESLERQTAAMQFTVDSMDIKGMNAMIDKIGSSQDTKLRSALADVLQNSKGRPGYVGMGDIAGLRTSTAPVSSEGLIRKSIESNSYSAEKIADTDKDELAVVGNYALNDASIGTADRQKFINNANSAATDPQLARKLGKNRSDIESIRTLDTAANQSRYNDIQSR